MKLYLVLAGIIFFTACKNGKKSEKEDPAKKDTIVTSDTIVSRPPPPGDGKTDMETFGDIKIGQHFTETLRVLGKPDTHSRPIEWEADGLMHEDWTYKNKGLELNMAAEILKLDSTRSLFSITAIPGCTFKTKANMGIGNTYAEVQQAYKKDIDKVMTDKTQIVVGSVYGGIIFSFDANGKVSQVFLGQAAE